jgi:hypothetical protein
MFRGFRGPFGPTGQRRNYSEDTIRNYLRTVEEFAEQVDEPPILRRPTLRHAVVVDSPAILPELEYWKRWRQSAL